MKAMMNRPRSTSFDLFFVHPTDPSEQAPVKQVATGTGDAFEDVLYGSESELGDSDDEDGPSQPKQKPKKKAQQGARLRIDDDEPMDLLHGAGVTRTFSYLLRSRRRT